tara:strand:- start:110 stop:394 length:285 start_codon:yes stop_codon:yes gene_type:complete
MSDFEDDLQLCEAQTDMLRRICNAIEEYGDHTDWKNNRTDQLLVLSSVAKWIGISDEFLEFCIDAMRSSANPERLPKQHLGTYFPGNVRNPVIH